MIKKPSYTFLYAMVIVLTGLITYVNILPNNFVWLDKQYIVNPAIAHSINLAQLLRGSALTGVGFYRPLNAIYYATVNTIFNNQAFYFHLIQICIHIINTLIVFSLFKKLMSRNIAFFMSLIFLVHPLNESTASFISNSADAIYMLFGLTALMIFIESKKKYKYIVISLLLLASLLTKESGVLFIFFILIYAVFFAKKEIKQVGITVITSTVAYTCIRYSMHGFQFYQIDLYPIMRLSLSERIINIPVILFYYTKSLFIPISLGINRRFTITSLTREEFYFPLFVDVCCLIAVVASGYHLYKIKSKLFKTYLLFACSFGISLLTLIQLFPLDYTVATRWFYFPMFALLGMVGTYLYSLPMTKRLGNYLAVIGLVIIVLLVNRTIKKNTYWKDDITLFSRAAAIEDNFITEAWLANAYLDKGDTKNALLHINKSIAMFPYDNNIVIKAFIYEKMHEEQRADEYYQQALQADNYAPYTHDEHTFQLLIQYYLRVKQNAKARKILSSAKKEYPENSYFLTLSAMIDYNNRQKIKAIGEIQRAYTINPHEPVIREVYERIIMNQPLEFAID